MKSDSKFNKIFIQNAEYLMGNEEMTLRVKVDYANASYEVIPLKPETNVPAELLVKIKTFVENMIARKSRKNVFKD